MEELIINNHSPTLIVRHGQGYMADIFSQIEPKSKFLINCY